MLTEICQYLHNWFNRKPDGSDYPKQSGSIAIENGELITSILADGQYFRVIGSLFNDGVHKYGDSTDTLKDETFEGEVWSMGIPADLINLADEMTAWKEQYEKTDSPNMSPFASESFGGYSYSKQQGSASTGALMSTCFGVYANRLSPWRKV